MSIRDDLNRALEDERIKRQFGKRAKAARFVMGPSALAALAADGGADRNAEGTPIAYRTVPIEPTDEFPGWELRS